MSRGSWKIQRKKERRRVPARLVLSLDVAFHFFFYAHARSYVSLARCTWFLLVFQTALVTNSRSQCPPRPPSHPSYRAPGAGRRGPPMQRRHLGVFCLEGHLAGVTTHAPQPLLPPQRPYVPPHPLHVEAKPLGRDLLLPRTRRHQPSSSVTGVVLLPLGSMRMERGHTQAPLPPAHAYPRRTTTSKEIGASPRAGGVRLCLFALVLCVSPGPGHTPPAGPVPRTRHTHVRTTRDICPVSMRNTHAFLLCRGEREAGGIGRWRKRRA